MVLWKFSSGYSHHGLIWYESIPPRVIDRRIASALLRSSHPRHAVSSTRFAVGKMRRARSRNSGPHILAISFAPLELFYARLRRGLAHDTVAFPVSVGELSRYLGESVGVIIYRE